MFTSTFWVISCNMESVNASLSIFVATVLDKNSKIEYISGRFFFSLQFIYTVQDHGFDTIDRLSLFSLIELNVSGVIFNSSKALLSSLSDSWDMIDIVNECYNLTLCATVWWLDMAKRFQAFDKSSKNKYYQPNCHEFGPVRFVKRKKCSNI